MAVKPTIHYVFSLSRVEILFFFFFQAEDGIRDLTVTGVQTCALPISCRRTSTDAAGVAAGGGDALLAGVLPTPAASVLVRRHGLDLGAVVSASHNPYGEDRKSGVEGKSVDLGGRRIIKKKKRKKEIVE